MSTSFTTATPHAMLIHASKQVCADDHRMFPIPHLRNQVLKDFFE
jgi:hypothetical protein